jgi:hypothetical protein
VPRPFGDVLRGRFGIATEELLDLFRMGDIDDWGGCWLWLFLRWLLLAGA